MKLPTKAQWLEIAEAFDTPRNAVQASWIEHGSLCFTFDNMGFDRHIGCYHDFLQPFDPTNHDEFECWWPTTNAGDRERAFFCILMSAITEAGDMESLIEEV